MYALKRILAYAFDLALVGFLSGLAFTYVAKLLGPGEAIGPLRGMALSYGSMAFTAGIPIVIFGALTGAFGWTPGKLIFFLRVRNSSGRAPGIAQGILREIIKYASLSFMFLGALWALYGIVTSESAFYDEWIGPQVDDLRPSGLTETQKRWRQFQRANR